MPLQFASTPEAASEIALELREPVALKILSPDITNKSEVGGDGVWAEQSAGSAGRCCRHVRTGPPTGPDAVIDGFAVQPMQSRHNAYELMIGVRTGRRFGLVIFSAKAPPGGSY
ncbi:MAG: acetate--CoA ligase family protein [Candidatus Competibacteraceae bacterium]|nr:acetate--CoA ligase family protein [Candidatus Competibacteraceae bacterium]